MIESKDRNDPHAAAIDAARTPLLVLMGLRGSGKSTLGRMLAERLGTAFVDLDDRVAAALASADAGSALKSHGEPAFRKAEFDCLSAIIAREPSGAVIALGGGTPTAPGAADLLRDHAVSGRLALIYLHASPDTLRRRLMTTDTASRPSLTRAGTLDEIEAIYAQRNPLYCSLTSEHTAQNCKRLDIDALTVEQSLRGIMDLVRAGIRPRA